MAAPIGTQVVAARGGRVVWVNFGSAFGDRQLAILPGDGTRDFYAHMNTRIPEGGTVVAGQRVGTVGNRGNVTGPHLHFERHAVASGGWSCGIVRDPAPSLNSGTPPTGDNDMPDIVNASPRPRTLPPGEWATIEWTVNNDPENVIRPNDDPAGIRLGGRVYSLVTAWTVENAPGTVLRIRTVQREGGSTTRTHPIHRILTPPTGTGQVQDVRNQRAPADARIRFQVASSLGGRLTDGNLYGLLW